VLLKPRDIKSIKIGSDFYFLEKNGFYIKIKSLMKLLYSVPPENKIASF